MPEVDITDTSKAIGVLGFYVCVFGLVSYVLRERLFISDSLVALATGIAVGPVGLDWVNSSTWTNNNVESHRELVYQTVRIVVGVQVLCAGISLPKAYLRKEWLALFILLVPCMTFAWLICGSFIYLLIPKLTFLEALCAAACVTPTDPVLANSIVKGRYAEDNVPNSVRDIISAESGANDGLGYPFIFLALYIIQHNEGDYSIGGMFERWFVDVWIYDIFLSIAMGASIGFLARVTLKEAERRKMIDHESFIAYGFGLSFFTLCCVGIIGSDDILACFICGNVFTWDDWFRVQTQDHAFQDILDSIINTATFIFIGTLIPFDHFSDISEDLKPWRFVVMAICLLVLKRLPLVTLLYKYIPPLKDRRQGLFAGWFGPIGVSAIYYLSILQKTIPESRENLRYVADPIVYSIIMSSVIVHGCTLPVYEMSSVVRRTFTKTTTSGPTTPQNGSTSTFSTPMQSFIGSSRLGNSETPA